MKQPLLGGHPRGTHGPGEPPLLSAPLLSGPEGWQQPRAMKGPSNQGPYHLGTSGPVGTQATKGSSPEQAGGLLESGRGGGRTGLRPQAGGGAPRLVSSGCRQAAGHGGVSHSACGGRGGGGAQVSSISASRRAAGALSRSVAPSALVS